MKLILYSLKHQPSPLLVVIIFLAVVNARSPRVKEENVPPASTSTKGVLRDERHLVPKEGWESTELGMELFPTGSSLPDCTHACGPCFPCKRVMVSFKCSLAESCPIVYRCMCKGKYYHVPSN